MRLLGWLPTFLSPPSLPVPSQPQAAFNSSFLGVFIEIPLISSLSPFCPPEHEEVFPILLSTIFLEAVVPIDQWLLPPAVLA